jgi:transposase
MLLLLTTQGEFQMNELRLTEREKRDYEAVKRCADGHKSVRRLAAELSRCEKTARRYLAGYLAEGRPYFRHGNRNRKPAHALPDETRAQIVALYKQKYNGATYAHFTELLAREERLSFSESCVRSVLRKNYVLSPKATGRTRREARRELVLKKKEAAEPERVRELAAALLTLDEAHPSRPRKKYFGELLQIDASEHLWFGEEKATLHVAVDDCTGALLGAFFDRQETLQGYYRMTEQILTEYGIPAKMLTDNRAVFIYKLLRAPNDENDTRTQFAYACKNLGIELCTTSVPQAKGRVERMFDTLQRRLPLELKLANVWTTGEANAFLREYLPRFNAKFAISPASAPSVFIPMRDVAVNRALAVLSERTVDNGSAVSYGRKRYALTGTKGENVFFARGTKGTVVKTLDGYLYFTVADKTYALTEIPLHEPNSKTFDPPETKKPAMKTAVPPTWYPWRHTSFSDFKNSLPHHKTGT